MCLQSRVHLRHHQSTVSANANRYPAPPLHSAYTPSRWLLLACAGLLLGCEKEAPPRALSAQSSANAETGWLVKEDLARKAAEHIALSPETEAQREHNRTDQDTQRVFAGWQRLRRLTPLRGPDGQPFVYVANYTYGGWALIAADGHMRPLLGFSEHGSFAVEQLQADGNLAVTLERNREHPTLPEGMLDWLETTQELVTALRANPDGKNAAPGSRDAWITMAIDPVVIKELPDGGGSGLNWRQPGGNTGGGGGGVGDGQDMWPPVGGGGSGGGSGSGGGGGGSTYSYSSRGPLLTTNWGQDCGYNDLVPSGTYSCTRMPTGCVPTALAQVLYFHRWPSTFNWANMPSGGAYTSRFLSQNSAPELARLMLVCGNSVGVLYRDNGSSANTADVERALKGAWNYVTPFNYSSADFVNGPAVNPAINIDLNAYRPSIVAASTGGNGNGGHAWVCDGYVFPSITNSVGTFGYRQYHMNWGWNGRSNGFFNCEDWNVTDNAGIVHNYQYNHRAIVNIHR